MPTERPTVLITGVAGNLASRLLPLLTGCNVIGVDFHEPSPPPKYDFYQVDLGEESSCATLVSLLIARRVQCVLHLAFVLDPIRTGVLELDHNASVADSHGKAVSDEKDAPVVDMVAENMGTS